MSEGPSLTQTPTQKEEIAAQVRAFLEKRRHQRFKLDVQIKVYSEALGLLLGKTMDISESGISAFLKGDVAVGKVVTLEFSLAFGAMHLLATVRQRNAFRYGFEFLDPTPAICETIRRSCDLLPPCP